MGLPTSPTMTLIYLVTGVILLLYGVRLISDTLQRTTNLRMKQVLTSMARQPLACLSLGGLTAAVTQSSSAISTLLVGMVDSGLIALHTAFLMLLGANIGSTLVVQLLTLDITEHAFVILGLGTAAALFMKRTPLRPVGQALFAFGLIIIGLAILETASQPIANHPLTAAVLNTLVDAPLVLGLIGCMLAIIFTSSAASIGLVIILAANGALPVTAALALMLGANVGTTMMALLSAIGSNSNAGRRLAYLHSGTKLIGVLVFFLFLTPLTALLAYAHNNAGVQVAIAHSSLNVLLMLAFTPLAGPLVQLVYKLVPEQKQLIKGGPHHLDPTALATPAVALGQATREVVRMTDVVSDMLKKSLLAFDDQHTSIPATINTLDNKLDLLEDAVKRYLTRLDEKRLTAEQLRRETTLFYIITDLEAIGDIIDKQIMRLARRKHRDQAVFSPEDWQAFVKYHHEVQSMVQRILAAVATQDIELANQCLQQKADFIKSRRASYLQHIHHLRQGSSPSLASSPIYADLLNAMGRILSHAFSIAQVIGEEI